MRAVSIGRLSLEKQTAESVTSGEEHQDHERDDQRHSADHRQHRGTVVVHDAALRRASPESSAPRALASAPSRSPTRYTEPVASTAPARSRGPALASRERPRGARLAARPRSKPSWRASDCSAAGDSARSLGGAVNQARSHSGEQRSQHRARRPCPRARRARAPAGRPPSTLGQRLRRAPRTASGLCAPSSTRQRIAGARPAGVRAPPSRPPPRAPPARAAATPRRRAGRSRAATRASAKLRRWNAPRARRRRRPASSSGATTMRAPRSPATRSATAQRLGRQPGAERERRRRAHDGELLLGDVVQRRPQPARVLEPDVRQRGDARLDHDWSRRSVRRARPRSTATSTPCSAISHSAAAVSSSNCVTWSSLGERAVDALGRPRGARDRRREGIGAELAARRAAGARGRRSGAARCRPPCAGRGARRIAAIMRVVEDLPFVPSTWIVSKRRCGEPSTVIIRRMRSRPKRIPNSSSERRCASARC